MRGRSRHRQVRAEMALRHQEDHPKEQCRQTDTPCFATHVPDKTKLRTDWLQGQAPCPSALRPSEQVPWQLGVAPGKEHVGQVQWAGTSKYGRALHQAAKALARRVGGRR